ncbi:hypothetical protein Taro_025675 [Colocasia esculenta]|uniref:Uncharacterized protein n=1 Tax=Colocasia esculenta TaxID=4460 RepID=A0A843VEX3_COLES|nr:hypothetical protein [Colocasia esculenta]
MSACRRRNDAELLLFGRLRRRKLVSPPSTTHEVASSAQSKHSLGHSSPKEDGTVPSSPSLSTRVTGVETNVHRHQHANGNLYASLRYLALNSLSCLNISGNQLFEDLPTGSPT